MMIIIADFWFQPIYNLYSCCTKKVLSTFLPTIDHWSIALLLFRLEADRDDWNTSVAETVGWSSDNLFENTLVIENTCIQGVKLSAVSNYPKIAIDHHYNTQLGSTSCSSFSCTFWPTLNYGSCNLFTNCKLPWRDCYILSKILEYVIPTPPPTAASAP